MVCPTKTAGFYASFIVGWHTSNRKKVKTMKRFITISLVSAMFAAATPAQSSNAWMEQWNKAKTGRYSPMEEARQRAARANATSRGGCPSGNASQYLV